MASPVLPPAPPGLLRALVLFHEPDLLGAATSVLNVVDRLRALGWSMSGWLPGEGPLVEAAAERLTAVAGAERPLAVSVRGWRQSPGVVARARATPRYLSALRAALFRLRPHLVHANTLRSLPEAMVARSLGLPVVFHVHELPPPSAKRAAALRLAARTGDVLVCVSEAVGAIARPHAGSTPVVIARNGLASAELARSDRERPFTVGTVGTVSRLKGTDVFFRAASLVSERVPGIRFEHAGEPSLPHDAALEDELRALLSSPVLRETAVMHGRKPAAEVLARSDVFVLPSRMDAFPLASLEAMAAGLPVIASRVGGIPEQIDHLESGVLVPPGDPGALADSILRLHDDAALRRRLASAASRRIRDEFTVEHQAAGLHRAYLLALNRRFGPPSARAAAERAA